MASVSKHASGWRVQVYRRGIRKSKVFPTKREAQDWGSRQEYLIENEGAIASKQPLRDVLDRYAHEVSTTKRGAKWEKVRLAKIGRDDIGAIRLCDLSAQHIADWRDRRSREVAPGSVRREMVLLSSVLSTAMKDWGLITKNPAVGVRKPAEPPHRERLPTADELARLAHVAGNDLSKTRARAFQAFRFSMQTAMRAGEVCGLEWDHIDLEARVAHLPRTKNGTSRDVPLTSEAARLLSELPKASPAFGMTTAQLDASWRGIRDRAGIEGLTFHDSRHAGITMLAQKLDVLALARAVGHRDIRMLQVYYNESAADIAKRLG